MLPEIPKGVSYAKFFEIGMIFRGGFGKGGGRGRYIVVLHNMCQSRKLYKLLTAKRKLVISMQIVCTVPPHPI